MERGPKNIVLIATLLLVAAGFILLLTKLTNNLGISQKGNKGMKITSPAFSEGASIPAVFTCQGQNINPELDFNDVPANTETLALIMDDPDAPMGTFVHWVLWNIPKEINKIPQSGVPAGAQEGSNGSGKRGYAGPCPPSGTHHYHFKLYALDTGLTLDPATGKAQLEQAMQGHILDQAELIGLYSK